MQIHNNTLIAECSAYDFKEMLERKKVKSWLNKAVPEAPIRLPEYYDGTYEYLTLGIKKYDETEENNQKACDPPEPHAFAYCLIICFLIGII